MRAVTERSEDTVGRLGEAFQRELLGVVDRLVKAAAAEADHAAERARAAGQVALDAAAVELEQRAKQCADLTESVRHLETRVAELGLALHTAQTELSAERVRIRGLGRQLAAQTADRARLLSTLKTVQQACALSEVDNEDEGAGADAAPADAKTPDAATSAPGVMPARRLRFVGAEHGPAVEVPSSLAAYTKPLFPRETPRTGQPSGGKTDEARNPRSRTSL
jgi:chromosome segregation ATPase